jgi:hypothetical protein
LLLLLLLRALSCSLQRAKQCFMRIGLQQIAAVAFQLLAARC